jgi:hypothetical protein
MAEMRDALTLSADWEYQLTNSDVLTADFTMSA